MKVLNGLESISLGNGRFYAITCGEVGAGRDGRKLGFIPIAKSLAEKIDKTIEEVKENYVKSCYDWSYNIILKEDDLVERERRIGILKEKYQNKYEIDSLKTEATQRILEHKEILKVLENVKIVKTKRGGMLLVENDKTDDYYLYSTSFYGGYRGCTRDNVTELEKEGQLEILKTGVSAQGLAGNMGWSGQYIIKSNKALEIEVMKTGDKEETDNILVVNINGAKEYSLREYKALKDIQEN